MLTYWVKWQDGGWVASLGGKRLLGPAQDRNDIEVAVCDMARNAVYLDDLEIVVMRKERGGGESPVGRFGGKPKGPKAV
jgi:hypothetical protein